jgi:uncharacterized protein YdiU (UPF0061 family)
VALLRGQRAKLGLAAAGASDDAADSTLVADWLALLQAQSVDYTLAWRRLGDAAEGRSAALRGLFAEPQALAAWLARWQDRCTRDEASGGPGAVQRAARMRRVNPWVIARNHRVEEALAQATDHSSMDALHRLLRALRQPFDEATDSAEYAEPAPADVTARYQTFCGT